MIRNAMYSGSWYPAHEKEAKTYLDPNCKRFKAFGAVVPHAGWIYSGKTAGKVFSSILPADIYFLIGPNHSGLNAAACIFPDGIWKFPWGNLKVDRDMTAMIMKESEFIEENLSAHAREHSLEVLCPFILMTSPQASIVPIIMRDYSREVCEDIGRAVAKSAVMHPEKKAVIIASSDMSHYEPAPIAQTLDDAAIAEMLNLDPVALLNIVEQKGISMCGAGPVAVMIYAARHLGAHKADLIEYTNSGNVTGDDSAVVGYAGIIVY